MPWSVFDVAAKEKEISELEKMSAQPDFWLDQAKAQETMRKLAEKKRVVEQWRDLEKKMTELTEFLTLASEDASLQAEVERELESASVRLEEMEFQMTLSGPYDNRNALL